MKRLAAFLAACAALFAAGQAAGATPCIGAYSGKWPQPNIERFNDGSYGSAEQSLQEIAQANGKTDFGTLLCSVNRLQQYFDLRAGRQQTFLDLGANTVFAGATASFLSASAGAATQGIWTALTTAPIVLGEFNAYEPTRDLYQASALALSSLSARYQAIDRDMTLLGAAAASPPQAGQGCQAVDAQLRQAHGWPDEDRLAFQPALNEMAEACLKSLANRRQLEVFAASAGLWRPQLTVGYRNDVLQMVQQVANQDRALRYTPIQTVSAIAAAPFQAVGSLLSGQNAKAAAETLKSQRTIDALHFTASPLLLGAAPDEMGLPPDIPPAALERAFERDEAAKALQDARSELLLDKISYDDRAVVARRLALEARGGDIETDFDTQTRVVTVKLTSTDASNP